MGDEIPPHVHESLRLFWDVRNRIVHGRDATDAEVAAAIDSGISLWRALGDLSHSITTVVKANLPLFSDAEGMQALEDATGVELEMNLRGPASLKTMVLPTSRGDYRAGMRVRWSFNHQRRFGKTWFRDPVTGEIKNAFTGSMEFNGAPVSRRAELTQR
jgi:hypothetical protein